MPVWNNTFEANPKGTDTPAEGDDRIRELKAATRERIEHEHTMNLGSGVVGEDGWHRAGSAKVYVGANAPTHRPNGSAVLDAQDDGRLWLSSVDFSLRAYRHAAGATTAERWEIVSGSGGSGENYVKNNLTKPNIAGVFNDTTGTTTVSWDATATDLLNVGALKIVLTNAAVGRFVDIDLSPLNANNVGQQWSIKLSYKLDTAADDLVSFFLFDGTTEVPTTLNSLPYGGGVLQKAVGAVYPTNVLNNVRLRLRFKDSTACTLYLADLTVGPTAVAILAPDATLGSIVPYAGATVPDHTWMFCDGAEISRAGYSELFTRIGTSFGAGNGTTTFNLPDMRGAAPAGVGTSVGYTQSETIELGTKYNDQVQQHLHRSPAVGGYMCQQAGSGTLAGGASTFGAYTNTGTMITDGTNGTPRNGNVTRGKRVGVNFIIKVLRSGNINLVQDFQEFASNDGSGGTAAGAEYTTGMKYGPEGSNIVAVNSSSVTGYSATSYRVDFLRPIQDTDKLYLEIKTANGWESHIFPNTFQGVARYGVSIERLSDPRQIRVVFGNAGMQGTTTGGYGTASVNAWGSSTNLKWRVRKISNGNMAEFDTRKLDGSVNVTGNYTVGNEQTVNVEASVANITIPAGLPIGTRKTIRKLHATTTSSVNILRSGSEVFTSASLTSVPIFGNGSFWIIEKVTSTRWELVGGSDSRTDSNGYFEKLPNGSMKQNSSKSVSITAGGYLESITFPTPFISKDNLSINLEQEDLPATGGSGSLVINGAYTVNGFSWRNAGASVTLTRYRMWEAFGRWY